MYVLYICIYIKLWKHLYPKIVVSKETHLFRKACIFPYALESQKHRNTNTRNTYTYLHTCIYLCPSKTILRTNGVGTHGAIAKVHNFDGPGKKARPGTFGKTKVG